MVLDSSKDGAIGRLVIYGSIISVSLAIVAGIYSVGQNAAAVSSEVESLQDQIHVALQTGEERLARVEEQINARIDRNCRILSQLDQDIRLHALETGTSGDFPDFPSVSC